MLSASSLLNGSVISSWTVEVEIVTASRAATSQGQGHGKLYCPAGAFVLAYDIYQTAN